MATAIRAYPTRFVGRIVPKDTVYRSLERLGPLSGRVIHIQDPELLPSDSKRDD